ncbi:MAG: hypothetical protein WC264_03410 [Candidatus Paceibacterota bacterium]|jgi:hypothetical protein
MKKNTLSFLILFSGILISSGIIGFANAQTTDQTKPSQQTREQKSLNDIQYPIPELGNCKSKNDCKTFCDDSKNIDACLTFAEQRNLMSSEEISNAKKFKDDGMVGPGSCKGQTECEQYCENSTHLEECITFAQKNGLMSDKELKDSQKVLTAIKNGIKPPSCSGPKKCDAYCSNPKHMEECMTFSLAADMVPDNQKEQMQKTLDVIKKGIKPPACQPNPPSDQLGQSEQTDQSSNGLPACDEYCGTHMEECMTFSLAADMVPDNQKEQMQKMLSVLKQGIKPPACQPNPPDQSGNAGGPNEGQGFNPGSGVNDNGPDLKNNSSQPNQSGQGLQACDQYCADSTHVEECVKFSVAIGNMTEQQAQMSLKTGGKGPGGCMGKDACDTFCNNPDNQETCFNFAKDNGMISEEDLQRMQNNQPGQGGSMKPGQNQNNQGQINEQIQPWADMCKPDENGNPTELACVDENGKFIASAKVGSDKEPICPTGSTAKCGNYQQNNQQRQPEDKFQPGPGNINFGGQQMPQQSGPGGCKGPEECNTYCESHQEECKNFQPQQNQQGQTGQVQQQQPQFNQGDQPGQMQPGQPNQFNQLNQPNQLNQLNQPGQQPGQPGEFNQPGQMQPQQQFQQQNPPEPSSPSGFLQRIVQKLLANVLSAF